jgi:ubiquinone/menaquinone biosynthesis C-methylase UbiE
MISEWTVIEKDIKSKTQLLDRWYQLILYMIKSTKLNISEKTSILEVGCGLGGFCFWLNNHNIDVIGLDFAPKRIDAAKKLGKDLKKRVNFIIGDARALPFKDTSQGIVICSEALEHIPSYGIVFNELVRVVKNFSFIIITVPNIFNMTWFLKPFELPLYFTSRKGQPSDVNYFSMFTINRLFSRKDLKVIMKRGIGLLSFRSKHLKLIEYKFNKPRDKLKFMCINIGVLAQKASSASK